MEHRCGRRVPVSINTLIYKHGVPVAMGRIKDASNHGLYLETDYQDVRELQKLELEVLLGKRIKDARHCFVRALVVRKSNFGFGLDLEILEDAGSRSLEDYITHRLDDEVRMHPSSDADANYQYRRNH